MKSVFCEVLGVPNVGDELRICATHKVRGGRSEASVVLDTTHFWRTLEAGEKPSDREVWNFQPDPAIPPIVRHKMTASESAAAIATSLSAAISRQWSGDLFSCRAKGAALVITTNDDDINFFPMLNGTEAAGRDVITVE